MAAFNSFWRTSEQVRINRVGFFFLFWNLLNSAGFQKKLISKRSILPFVIKLCLVVCKPFDIRENTISPLGIESWYQCRAISLNYSFFHHLEFVGFRIQRMKAGNLIVDSFDFRLEAFHCLFAFFHFRVHFLPFLTQWLHFLIKGNNQYQVSSFISLNAVIFPPIPLPLHFYLGLGSNCHCKIIIDYDGVGGGGLLLLIGWFVWPRVRITGWMSRCLRRKAIDSNT